MSKVIKGSIFLLLGIVLFFVWNSSKKEPVALTPEELIKTMKAEKIETHSLNVKEFKPIFTKIKSLTQLEFYKMDAIVTKKILMVYFYSDGCYYCEKMKNITFADSRVQKELVKNYVAISVNYSKYKDVFRKKFTLNATPTIIFFDREGNQMKEDISYGYQGAEDFYNKIELLAEPF